MDAEDVPDTEAEQRIVWSTSRLYLSLLETFPKHVQDFQTRWNNWQQDISGQEFDSSVPSPPAGR